MRTRVLFATAALAGLVGLAAAQDPKGPKAPKTVLPPDVVPAAFRMFLVTDTRFQPVKTPDGKESPDPRNRQGKVHCLVCEYGLNPVVAVFVRSDPKTLGADSGVAKLAKNLDALIPKYRSDKLAGFVAFLLLEGGKKVVTVKVKQSDGTEVENKVEQDQEYPDDEKRDVYAKDVRDFATALTTPNVPFGLAADKSEALNAWGVKDDDVTVVFYYRMRVVGQPWRFKNARDLTDEKVAEILKTVETTITGKK